MKRVLVFAWLLAGCPDELGGVGAPCESSGECAEGLVCDFGRRMHTCQPTSTVRPDMAVRADGGDDAGMPDLAARD